jgi:hypothetical protein
MCAIPLPALPSLAIRFQQDCQSNIQRHKYLPLILGYYLKTAALVLAGRGIRHTLTTQHLRLSVPALTQTIALTVFIKTPAVGRHLFRQLITQ